jgi:hypothetical protein
MHHGCFRLGLVVLMAACAAKHTGDAVDAAVSEDSNVPPDAAQAACTAAYCDDFEAAPTGALVNNAALGAWTAKVNGAVTLAAIDAVKPHSGTKALHVTVPAGAAAGATLSRLVPAGLVAGNNLYGRAMVYFSGDGGNAAPVGVHSWLFQALGTSTASGAAVSMNLGDGGTKMQLNYHTGATEMSVQGAAQMVTGAWHCVQWQYDGSGTPVANAATVWVDGTVVVSVAQSKGWQFATPWTGMNIGFQHYQTLAAPADVYIDDVAIDGAKVACP